MANVLDIRQFFRRSPREWLRRYFEWRGVLAGFDWTSLRPRDLEPLMTAWLALDSTQRDEMMADFANIAMLATDMHGAPSNLAGWQLGRPREVNPV